MVPSGHRLDMPKDHEEDRNSLKAEIRRQRALCHTPAGNMWVRRDVFFSHLYKSQNNWTRASSVNLRVKNDSEIMGEFLNLESVSNEDCLC